MGEQQDWGEYIERIKRSGAGEYGAAHFMCSKHEHWKILWAAERIEALEAERDKLRSLLQKAFDRLHYLEQDCTVLETEIEQALEQEGGE